MTNFAILAASTLGLIYALFSIGLVRRACRPSCRECVHWQHCVELKLGIEGPAKKPCP
ncbi:MAG TPA: hypothetical protein VFA68_07205 [Terriglobales bacterium]|nr:hypothetical protein [Terriglobales bacterium]